MTWALRVPEKQSTDDKSPATEGQVPKLSSLASSELVSVQMPQEEAQKTSWENKIEDWKKSIRDLNPKIKESFIKPESYQSTWNKIFLTSYVIAVIVDPLFFYIPFIDENNLRLDYKLEIVALVLRSVTDIFYMLHIYFELRKGKSAVSWFVITGILAILPIPQVLILVIYYDIWDVNSWKVMRFLNVFILLQYVPRILRIFHSSMELKRSDDSLTGRVWVKGAFNFFLYITASHILGAFWYYFAIQRLTKCWKDACKKYHPRHGHNRMNLSLTECRPVNPSNATEFDFGIFADVLQSGIVFETADFWKKHLQCFWWGLRSISGFGQNLQTSSDVWETCFAALISVSGLLLFVYLIGNLQTYIQLATTRSHKNRRKMKYKAADVNLWMKSIDKAGNEEENLKRVIMEQLRTSLKKEEEIDLDYLLILLEQHIKSEKMNTIMKEEDLRDKCKELATYISEGKRMQRDKKLETATLWMSTHEIPEEKNKDFIPHLLCRLRDDIQDINLVNILSVVPPEQRTFIKKHLCKDMLKTVFSPKMTQLKKLREADKQKQQTPEEDIDHKNLEKGAHKQKQEKEVDKQKQEKENEDKDVFKDILDNLKPVIYKENSYIIREKEPLDFMLFITHGIAWKFGGDDEGIIDSLERGGHHGGELLDWQLSDKVEPFPIAKKHVKSHTRIDAFVLKAVDLQNVIPNTIKQQQILPNIKKYESLNSFESDRLGQLASLAAKQALKRLKEKKDSKEGGPVRDGGNGKFLTQDNGDNRNVNEDKAGGSSSIGDKAASGGDNMV